MVPRAKKLIIILTGVILMTSLLTLLAGCFRKIAGGDEPGTGGTSSASPTVATPGELCRIKLESSAGSMEYHTEFAIEVTPEEIVHAEYWPEEGTDSIDIPQKDHVPITGEQWADLEKIVGDLYPELRPIPEQDDSEPLSVDGEEIEILDGGDYWNFWLTWKTEEGEVTVRYGNVSDRRIRTLDDLLRELADPIGREIVWYDPPEIGGVFFHDDETDESFQLTDFGEERYYFITRWHEGKEKKDLTKIVDASVWPPFKEFLGAQDYARFPEGWSFHDPRTVTIYYTDGRQKTWQPDEEAAAALREFFLSQVPEVEKMEKKG